MIYLGIILAGGCGALLRYLVGRAVIAQQWTALPFGTLAVNVIGSFLMGYLSWAIVQKWQLSTEVQVIILTGFLGGFTTFSAFSLEIVNLVQNGASLKVVIYILLSICLSVAMCLAGLMLAKST